MNRKNVLPILSWNRRYWTSRELARLYGKKTPRAVQHWLERKQIPDPRSNMGGHYRFSRRAVCVATGIRFVKSDAEFLSQRLKISDSVCSLPYAPVIAFNYPGTTGNTFVLLNLAHAAVELGLNVCVIDLNFNGELTMSFADVLSERYAKHPDWRHYYSQSEYRRFSRKIRYRRTVADIFLGTASVEQLPKATAIPRVDCIPSRFDVLEDVTLNLQDRDKDKWRYRFSTALKKLRQWYDLIIIDEPSCRHNISHPPDCSPFCLSDIVLPFCSGVVICLAQSVSLLKGHLLGFYLLAIRYWSRNSPAAVYGAFFNQVRRIHPIPVFAMENYLRPAFNA